MYGKNDLDLEYITCDNFKVILDRINYIINNPYTTQSKPVDIIQLIDIRQFIYNKFNH